MNTRDLFNADHGAGKGDKPRTKFDENWVRRFGEIQFPKSKGDDGFKASGPGKKTKRYG